MTVMSLIYRVNEQRRTEESLFNWRADRLLVIAYDDKQRPVSFTPADRQALAAVHVAYDVTGHVTWWQRGDVIMTYTYDDMSGQLTEWTQTDQRQRLVHRYVYDENSHVVSSVAVEMCGNNFWRSIHSHSHNFILIPIPGHWNSETSIPFPFIPEKQFPVPFEHEQFQLLKSECNEIQTVYISEILKDEE